MSKRKQIANADMMGDAGIAFIHRTVNAMKFVWNATKLDAGTDGYIEIRDWKTSEVTNCILQVQSKAGHSWFKAETESTFEFFVSEIRSSRHHQSDNTSVPTGDGGKKKFN